MDSVVQPCTNFSLVVTSLMYFCTHRQNLLKEVLKYFAEDEKTELDVFFGVISVICHYTVPYLASCTVASYLFESLF